MNQALAWVRRLYVTGNHILLEYGFNWMWNDLPAALGVESGEPVYCHSITPSRMV